MSGFRAVALDAPDPVASIRGNAPDGVDRIIEVSFSDNVDLDAAGAKDNVVIAAYATHNDRRTSRSCPFAATAAE